jgi:hypothetical protein
MPGEKRGFAIPQKRGERVGAGQPFCLWEALALVSGLILMEVGVTAREWLQLYS